MFEWRKREGEGIFCFVARLIVIHNDVIEQVYYGADENYCLTSLVRY